MSLVISAGTPRQHHHRLEVLPRRPGAAAGAGPHGGAEGPGGHAGGQRQEGNGI